MLTITGPRQSGKTTLARLLRPEARVETSDQQITEELIALVRERIGSVAVFKEVHVVPRLPKTRSGKILRKTMRQIFNGEEYVIPSTIDDPESLSEIEALSQRQSNA